MYRPRWRNNFLLSRFESFENIAGDQRKLITLILITTTLSILPVGYHIIVLNVPSVVIQDGIARRLFNEEKITTSKSTMDILWAFIVSCQSIGALVGCFLLPKIQRSFGTKKALMLINNGILLISSFFLFIAFYVNTLFFLITGRILVGVYTGIGSALVPIYIQELAPKTIKGTLSCFVHVGVCIGSAAGSFLSITWILGGPTTWNFLLAIPAICGLIQIGISRYIPDSPNYFLQKGDKPSAAESIKYYYNFDDFDDDVAIQEYKNLVTKTVPQISFWKAMEDEQTRQGICLGIIISASQIFSGSMGAISYSTSMFSAVSFASFLIPFVPTLGSLASIFLTLPSFRWVETCGRKPLLIRSLILCAVSQYLMLIFSLLAEAVPESWGSVGFAIAFVIFGLGYNLGVGPISYFIPVEIVPGNSSGVALAIAVSVNWFCSLISNLLYYPLIESVGAYSYLLFALPTTIAVFVLYKKLPENIGHPKIVSGELVLTCNVSDYFIDEEDSSAYGTFDTTVNNSVKSSRPSTSSR